MFFANKNALVPLFLGGASLLGLVVGLSQTQAAETRQPNATTERVAKIEAYSKDSHVAVLHDGTQLPVSRAGYGRLKALVSQEGERSAR